MLLDSVTRPALTLVWAARRRLAIATSICEGDDQRADKLPP
jgi:hypothetical protein